MFSPKFAHTVLTALLVLAMTGCGSAVDSTAGSPEGQETVASAPTTSAGATEPISSLAEEDMYSTLEELAAASAMVVEGTITGTRRGVFVGERPGQMQTMEVLVRVSTTLKGSQPESLSFHEEGWDSAGRARNTPGVARSQAGQTGIFFLLSGPHPESGTTVHGLVNSQSRFFQDGESVRAGNQNDDFSKSQEKKTWDEFREDVRRAAA